MSIKVMKGSPFNTEINPHKSNGILTFDDSHTIPVLTCTMISLVCGSWLTKGQCNSSQKNHVTLPRKISLVAPNPTKEIASYGSMEKVFYVPTDHGRSK